MIHVLPNTLPSTKFGLAFSGGVDSVVFSHFLKQSRRDFDLYFFNHGDENDTVALEFAKEWANKLSVNLITNEDVQPLNKSECSWRDARYAWLESFKDTTILTGHNLEDIVSGYLMFWIKGQEKFIPVKRNNILRPFLLTSKEEIFQYANNHNLIWHEEEYNHDVSYSRVRVVKNILPEIYEINPGFDKMVKNRLIQKLKNEGLLQ